MKIYKQTILMCLLAVLTSGVGLYLVDEPWRSILIGIFTGSIVSVITSSVAYNVKKEEIFSNIGVELISTYNRLSFLYSRLTKCSQMLKNNEAPPSIVYKEIVEIYKIYEGYILKNYFDFALKNYDGLLLNNLIVRFFVSKEVKVLADIQNAHCMNNQYASICAGLNLTRAELDLAEYTGNAEQINNLINQIDVQYRYTLSALPQQLAVINYAMQNFEQVKKLTKPWYMTKQNILTQYGLFEAQIHAAEQKLKEECKHK